jgi:hypothetical protein
MARVTPIDRELRIATADIDPQAIAALLASTAREALADAIASGAGSPDFTRYVNGREGVLEDAVVPPGPILYEFNRLNDIVGWTLDFLRERSPVRSGRYRASHFVLANGRQVDPDRIPPGVEIVITNDQPYARKIQIGAMMMSVPPGIYEDARQFVQRNFGQLVAVQLRFVPLAGGYVLKRGGGRKGRRAGEPITYPALVINLKQ